MVETSLISMQLSDKNEDAPLEASSLRRSKQKSTARMYDILPFPKHI
jgi:hypothetical protein